MLYLSASFYNKSRQSINETCKFVGTILNKAMIDFKNGIRDEILLIKHLSFTDSGNFLKNMNIRLTLFHTEHTLVQFHHHPLHTNVPPSNH